VDLCGLCTQHLFEPDGFFERLSSPGGHLQPDLHSSGLGFDDVLERLPWRKLD
jgi:O-succinylbenzoate synthase